MGYIKSRANGTVQGMYCDICGKEYVRVVSNPNNSSQDMCVKCYNDFYNGGQQKDKQIEELKAENEKLKEENTLIKQIAERVSKINECETALEEYDTTQQNRLLFFNNQLLLKQLKDNTKQVCEKIRKQIEVITDKIFSRYDEYSVISDYDSTKLRCYDQILEILEKLEQENC